MVHGEEDILAISGQIPTQNEGNQGNMGPDIRIFKNAWESFPLVDSITNLPS